MLRLARPWSRGPVRSQPATRWRARFWPTIQSSFPSSDSCSPILDWKLAFATTLVSFSGFSFRPDASATTLEIDGRPFLILHNVDGAVRYRFDRRWSWFATVSGLSGETDFAQFVLQGAQGNGAGAIIQSQVIESTAFTVETGIVAPSFGKSELQVSGSLSLAFAEAGGALPGMAAPMDFDNGSNILCILDRDEQPNANVENQALADTCTIRVAATNLFDLSALERLQVQVGYSVVDFDPGPFTHVVQAQGVYRRQVSRGLTGRLGLGALLAVVESVDAGTDVSPLPALQLGFDWRFINLRLFKMSLDLSLLVDGFAETVSQQFLLRATGAAALQMDVGRNFNATLAMSALTLGPELDSPPRSPIDDAELNELSSLAADLSLRWRLNNSSSFFIGGRFGLRGPHISRLGAETSEPSQIQGSGFVGLQVAYGTRSNQGTGGRGPVGGAGAGAGGGGGGN